MKLYVDEDSADHELVARLRKAGHDVLTPGEEALLGASDPRQFTHAVQLGFVLLTSNRDDFMELHELVQATSGSHSGLLIACFDNDPTRDLTSRGIANAIEAVGVPIANQIYILNHWR